MPASARTAREILVTGGTVYIGQVLVPALLARGHRVRVLARPASLSRVARRAEGVPGDVLDPESVAAALRPGDTVVHLVGTPRPGPAKAAEFVRVDLESIRAVVTAARRVGVAHLVYVSVAHPAPVMEAYVAARIEGERAITEAGLTATILRPWYVLGPRHRWPIVLVPIYALARAIPRWREAARRLGLVTLSQMVQALVRAVENPPSRSVRTVNVSAIRAAR
jgi:nucleoside-diphosphate-sugar epimerase